MPIYTNDPCDDGLFPVEPSLRSSIGIGPKVTKVIDAATKDWLDKHPEATTTVEEKSLEERHLKPSFSLELCRCFNTVADMQAATDLKDGMICHTNGFHSAGDGGAAFYDISTNGTANGMDVLALQGGLYATLVVTESYVTPEMFGAYGDDTSDDVAAMQRSIDFATERSFKLDFSVGKTYLVSTGIIISNVDVSMNSPIRYTGDGAAVMIGSSSSSVGSHSYKIWVTSSNVEYTNGSVGVQAYNATNCYFDIHTISGFEYGVVFSGYNAGFAYNHISVNRVINCMYSITLRSDGTSGWCNENYFYNGRLTVASSASYKNDFIGITIDSEHAYYANANTFSNMSIEGAAICIYVVYGRHNTFTRIRSEAATLLFKDENGSNWNYVNVSYGNITAETSGVMDIIDGSQKNYQALSMPVFDSGFLPSKSFSNNSYLWVGKDICYMSDNGSLIQIYKGTKYNDRLNITSRNIGVMVDTSRVKKFSISAIPYQNTYWRVFVVCYDENGNYINSGLKSNPNKELTVSTTAISGVTCWITGSGAGDSTFVELPSNCVKAFMGIIVTTNICGFRIFSDQPYVPIIGNQVTNGLASIPTCEGKVGDFCPSSATDNVLGWLYNGTSWVAVS